eukprot:scaffold86138_cov66-Cyclotella_meneghiniana.AAC.1
MPDHRSSQIMPSSIMASHHVPLMIVVFGRPGAGKTTVSEEAVRLLNTKTCSVETAATANYLHLDLDVCVPQWMRDNFAKGIYPTIQQRATFITDACKYVNEQMMIQSQSASAKEKLVVIIAFSFVNTDMRIKFREQFPHSNWILIDTTKDIAEDRITRREGHYYKGANNACSCTDEAEKEHASLHDTSENKSNRDVTEASDNNEWEFQPVDFNHIILDGCETISNNARRIVEFIQSETSQHSS